MVPGANVRPGGLNAIGHGGSAGRGGLGSFGVFGADPLAGSEFLLGLGGGEHAEGKGFGRRWQVWGQGGDVQTFQGAPTAGSGYEGDLVTGYLGVDTSLTDRWVAGVAVRRSRGDVDWRTDGSRGSLATTLTAAHPYVQWSDRTTSIWATMGGGRGEADNVHPSDRTSASGLGLRLGLVELRRRLSAAFDGLQFGVRADAGWAQLWTAAGEEITAGATAAVSQARVGAELSRPVRLGGLVLAPFGEAHVRRDGGAGQTGEGVEVLGGLRATAGKVRVVAQGRTLIQHSAAGYRERGFGLTLSVRNQGQEGLSLSVSPRWGNATTGGALWQDHVYRGFLPGAAGDEWELAARGGNGMRLPSGRMLTAFGVLSHSAFGQRFFVGGGIAVPD